MEPVEQRWRKGKTTFIPPQNLFSPNLYGVEPITEKKAKDFICKHHYSKSYPAARFRAGLFRTGGTLCGVAVFSVPMQQKVIPAYAPDVLPNNGVELGRFVLLDDVQFNGETWFLSRAFKLLRKEKNISVVISYSDPIERRTIDGTLIKPGHIGTIYKAFNGRFLGRSRKRKLLLAPDGTVINERSLTKLKKGEQGHEYVYRQLLLKGAPNRKLFEDNEKYVKRVSESFRKVSHPGNLVYSWSLDGSKLRPAKPYPKRGVT